MTEQALTPTQPYLLRALHDWCTDNGLTPYLAVKVDETVQVPREYVQNGEIVLNVSHDATGALKMGNEFIEFKARFGGVPREIMIPVDRVMAIYARENGQGMAFPVGGDASTPAAGAQGVSPQSQLSEAGQASAPAAAPRDAASARAGIQLVSSGGKPSSAPAEPGEDPPPSPPQRPKPPALKRVK